MRVCDDRFTSLGEPRSRLEPQRQPAGARSAMLECRESARGFREALVGQSNVRLCVSLLAWSRDMGWLLDRLIGEPVFHASANATEPFEQIR